MTVFKVAYKFSGAKKKQNRHCEKQTSILLLLLLLILCVIITSHGYNDIDDDCFLFIWLFIYHHLIATNENTIFANEYTLPVQEKITGVQSTLDLQPRYTSEHASP